MFQWEHWNSIQPNQSVGSCSALILLPSRHYKQCPFHPFSTMSSSVHSLSLCVPSSMLYIVAGDFQPLIYLLRSRIEQFLCGGLFTLLPTLSSAGTYLHLTLCSLINTLYTIPHTKTWRARISLVRVTAFSQKDTAFGHSRNKHRLYRTGVDMAALF